MGRIEQAFAECETHGAFREAIPAMRWLAEKLKQDKQLHDLQPGVSHATLVLRRGSVVEVVRSYLAKAGRDNQPPP